MAPRSSQFGVPPVTSAMDSKRSVSLLSLESTLRNKQREGDHIGDSKLVDWNTRTNHWNITFLLIISKDQISVASANVSMCQPSLGEVLIELYTPFIWFWFVVHMSSQL